MKLDKIFNAFGFPEDIKIIVFKLLASILHLANVEFGDGDAVQAKIFEKFEKNVDFASKLLKLPFDELKAALLFKSIKDNNSEIM